MPLTMSSFKNPICSKFWLFICHLISTEKSFFQNRLFHTYKQVLHATKLSEMHPSFLVLILK